MTIEDQILERAKSRQLGAFSTADFMDLHNYKRISKALETLEDQEQIVRLRRGIYALERNMDQGQEEIDVALALARQGGWKIAPSKGMARRYFGLDAEKEKDLYFVTTGPKRVVELDDAILHFRPIGKKESCFKRKNNLILYQVICHYDDHPIPQQEGQRLVERLDGEDRRELRTLYPNLCPKAKKGIQQLHLQF